MNSVVNLSQQLIKIPSTKDKPKNLVKILDVIKKQLSDYKVEEFNSKGIPSLLAYNSKTRPKKFKLILNGHLDVVTANPNYFKATIKGNRLTGRGAIDMKASVAVMTLVFKKLANKLNYPLGLQIVTDEEIGGFHGTKHQINKGVKADLVIAGEPTDLGLEIAAKGPLWLKLTTKGKTNHGAQPWKGINAIKIMSDNIQNISKLYPVPKKEVWKTTCNISTIKAGESVNQIPDQCICTLDVRRIPKDNPETIIKNIKSVVKNTKVEAVFKEPAHLTDLNNPLINKLSNSIKTHTKKTPKKLKKHGASDARHYAGANINTVCFGPKGDGLHSDNEWVDIKSLNLFYSILQDFLLNLKK